MYPNTELTYLTGKDGTGSYNFDKIKMPTKKEMKGLEYKFYVELDKKSQYSKDKQKQELMDLFQFERQYDAPVKTITVSDIIKNSDLVNKDEIIARYNDLNSQDAETKAQTIDQMITTANELGISQDLVVQSVTEIISGAQEHPATDELMSAIEQGFDQQLQAANQQADMGAISANDAATLQDPTAGLDPSAVAEAEDIIASGQMPM